MSRCLEQQTHSRLLVKLVGSVGLVRSSYRRCLVHLFYRTPLEAVVYREAGMPTNAPRESHVETTWKLSFPCRFKVEYTWCVCTDAEYTSRGLGWNMELQSKMTKLN